MEPLIIQVDFNSRDGPPQLGITVEAPHSVAIQQRQQQAAAKDYRNHDYQNCHIFDTNTNGKHNSNSNNNQQNQNNGTTTSNKQAAGIQQQNCKSINGIYAGLGGKPQRIQRGLQITHIQEGSVIDQNGQFRVGDIIVEVNSVDLQNRNFQEAQKILREFVAKQSSHGPLLLKVIRKTASSSSLPSTTGSQTTVIERINDDSPKATPTKKTSHAISASTPSPQSSTSNRHFVGALSTRKIGAKINIRLTKGADGGFGIKIAERDNMFGNNRPIYITAITTTGSAYRDGRLKEGDMLLEVNGIDLSGKSQPEITKMLKAVAVDETVEFVVSRPYTDQDHHNTSNVITQELNITGTNQPVTDQGCDSNTSLIDLGTPDQSPETSNHQFESKVDSILNVDGPGTYEYDIPLNDTKSAGLGLYLKFPGRKDKDLGIWVERVMVGGAAWKDGRLQLDDQILAINGINLMGLSNAEAFETLTAAVCRATTNTIRLKIIRRDPSVVATILHGTHTTLESSDLTAIGQQNIEPASSIQSCDDESIDGEERFQRDNFARQSVSEKRHAQMMARPSDKRSQKKSNSLDSIQTQDHVRESIVIPPRAGTVRIARNRKINESFRAAVDRSYESSMQSNGRPEYSSRDFPASNERSVDANTSYGYSMGYSTTSTNNDEKVLIRTSYHDGNNNQHKANHNNFVNNHHTSKSMTNHNGTSNKSNNNHLSAPNIVTPKEKKSSFLSKFFGSMKKLKKKNKDEGTTKTHAKSIANNHEPELNRSQSSKSSHSRFQQAAQPHTSSVPPNHQFQYHQPMANGLNQNHNLNMKPMPPAHRASLPTYHHQYQPPNNLAHHHIHHPSMTYSKVAYNMIPEPKPVLNSHQYSHSVISPHAPQQIHHQIPVDIPHQSSPYQTAPRMMQNHTHNGCHPYNQWQSPPPPQPPQVPVANGLWVANSVNDDHRIQQHNSIYGTHTHNNFTQLHNQRNIDNMAPHPTSFVPIMNGHMANQVANKFIHQSPVLPSHTATLPHPHHHHHHHHHLPNQQPQHIIYYDF